MDKVVITLRLPMVIGDNPEVKTTKVIGFVSLEPRMGFWFWTEQEHKENGAQGAARGFIPLANLLGMYPYQTSK